MSVPGGVVTHVVVQFQDVGDGLRVTCQVRQRGTLEECDAFPERQVVTKWTSYRLLTEEEWEAMRKRLAPGVEVPDEPS